MERWVQNCRHELLDRTLIGNQAHLLHALSEFESTYNQHRPTTSIDRTAPCTARHPCGRSPNQSSNRTDSTASTSVDVTDSAVSPTNTHMLPDQLGRNNQHPQCRKRAAR
ncbi:hypothetical protein ACFXDH_47905 [Streptomyces sp. NPDC059467]|uniref:hypothetical protein n=1 Tax=Streptomyces sp. NPDC059467 TaxID=3346844 RepID=UPI0036A87758